MKHRHQPLQVMMKAMNFRSKKTNTRGPKNLAFFIYDNIKIHMFCNRGDNNITVPKQHCR